MKKILATLLFAILSYGSYSQVNSELSGRYVLDYGMDDMPFVELLFNNANGVMGLDYDFESYTAKIKWEEGVAVFALTHQGVEYNFRVTPQEVYIDVSYRYMTDGYEGGDYVVFYQGEVIPVDELKNYGGYEKVEPLLYGEEAYEETVEEAYEEAYEVEEAYITVDVDPSFKGGDDAFDRWVANNIEDPGTSTRNGEVKVMVQFIVEKDGHLSNIEIQAVMGETMDKDEYAFYVEDALPFCPNWNPGMMGGEYVRVKMILPIVFK